jgi:hypothetical protein
VFPAARPLDWRRRILIDDMIIIICWKTSAFKRFPAKIEPGSPMGTENLEVVVRMARR